MDAGFFDVLQEPADDDVFSIGDAVDVYLDRILQELVDEDGLRLGIGDRLQGNGHVAGELFLRVHDLHRAPTEHVARTHDDGKPDPLGDGESIFVALGDAAPRTS